MQGKLERLVGGQRPLLQLACEAGIELFGVSIALVTDKLHQVQVVAGLSQYFSVLETAGQKSLPWVAMLSEEQPGEEEVEPDPSEEQPGAEEMEPVLSFLHYYPDKARGHS